MNVFIVIVLTHTDRSRIFMDLSK